MLRVPSVSLVEFLKFNEKTGFLEFQEGEKPVLVSPTSNAIENSVSDEKKLAPPLEILDYNGKPVNFPFDPYETYKIRLVNFANGAIYAIKHDSTLSETEKETRLNNIIYLLDFNISRVNNFKRKMDSSSNVSFSAELYQFYNEELPKASGLKAKHIALGEALYVWQEIPRPIRQTTYARMVDDQDTKKGYLEITQIDEPRISSLTSEQKNELRTLFNLDGKRPQWFNDLAPFAKNVLLTLLSPIAGEHEEKYSLKQIFNENRQEQPEWFQPLPPIAKTALKNNCIHAFPGIKTNIPPITAEEIKELQQIFNQGEKDRPKWFNNLPLLSQEALKTLLTADCNWNNYQKCHPTILRQIPGEANATTHRLIVTHVKQDGSKTVLSETVAVRQGAPTSFDMENERERKESAEENLKQMLSKEAIATARNEFKQAWEIQDEDDSEYKLPILLGGLLTSWEQANYVGKLVDGTGLSGGSSNSLMAREKSAAVEKCKDIPNVELFDLNVGVNNHRRGVVKPDKKFILFARDFYNKMASPTRLEPGQKEVKNRDEITKKLSRLNSAINALEALEDNNGKKSKYKGRNENLYTAALYDATTRLMHGYDTGNCKSSKDRKGVEFLMADAMLVYLAEQEARGVAHPVFPGINDTGEERKRFVKIFCELYASGHQLLIAHDNSPGSPGIKDEGILDKDIIKELQSMRRENAKKSFLDKHGSKIFIAASALVLGGVAGALIATGVLAPIGIAAGAIATELGISVIAGSAIGAGIAAKMIQVDKKDYSGVYGQSKQLADSNKPGSFWKKHRNKIFIGLGVLVVVGVAAGLIASGVLAPLGIVTAAVAFKITAGVVAAPVAAATLVGLRQIKEVRTDGQNSFSAQENFAKKGKQSSSMQSSLPNTEYNSSSAISDSKENKHGLTSTITEMKKDKNEIKEQKVITHERKEKVRSVIHTICDKYLNSKGDDYREDIKDSKEINSKNKDILVFIREKVLEKLDNKSKNQSALFQSLTPEIRKDLDNIIYSVVVDKYTRTYQAKVEAEAKAAEAKRPG